MKVLNQNCSDTRLLGPTLIRFVRDVEAAAVDA